jgi:hypothetical protein
MFFLLSSSLFNFKEFPFGGVPIELLIFKKIIGVFMP